MKIILLPHYFKKIALLIFILAITTLIINTIYPEVFNIENSKINWILKILILASLLTSIFTKEKNETEKISQLRLNTILVSVGFGVAFLIIDTISQLIFSDGKYDMKSGYELMMIIFLYYFITFNIKKKIKNAARA